MHTHEHKLSAKKKIFYLFWPFLLLLKSFGRALYLLGLKYEFLLDWGCFPNPEWFDHDYDLAFFPTWRKPHFFERGVYLQEVLKPSDTVLDLCCGDGSVTALFVSPKVKSVVGVDFDASAISAAKQKYGNFSNLSYRQMDIRTLDFPAQSFDLVTWDAAIEHFTQIEMDQIFSSIKKVLKPNGMLAGSTIAKQDHLQHHDHEHEFESTQELQQFLSRYFPHVYVWERAHDDRVNFYFRCATNNADLSVRSTRA